MRCVVRVMGLLCVVVLGARPAFAATLAIDLSRPSGTSLTVNANPGQMVSFQILNKLPNQAYNVVVDVRPIAIPPFATPAPPLGGFASDECKAILTLAQSLGTAKDESAIGEINRQITVALGAGKCTAPDPLQKINEWVSLTTYAIPGEFTVNRGEEIVVTITRADRAWTLTVSGGSRGEWRTTFGVTIVPSDDEAFFAKSAGEEKFVVTQEGDVKDVRLIPSVFFTWLPRKQLLRNFSIGPTAGLGLSKSRAALFGGIGVTYNWNLGFIAGVAVSPHSRLQGRYSVGEELKEDLDDAQLNREVYRPTVMFALTFRFASNPFAAGGDEEEAAGGGEKPKSTGKPGEKPGTAKPEEESKPGGEKPGGEPKPGGEKPEAGGKK